MHLDILKRLIGKEIDIIVDRPIGTTRQKFKDTLYPVNYGYIDGFLGGDKEFQDAYILKIGLSTFVPVYCSSILKPLDICLKHHSFELLIHNHQLVF